MKITINYTEEEMKAAMNAADDHQLPEDVVEEVAKFGSITLDPINHEIIYDVKPECMVEMVEFISNAVNSIYSLISAYKKINTKWFM